MKAPEFYRGREQTYLKHFFLEKYLERVGYNIGSFADELVYVDGFSGPWRSTDDAFEDTSFIIALNKLRTVREGIERSRKKKIRVRCLFIEKNPHSFAELQRAIADVTDIDALAINGDFEELIPDVIRFVGSSFALVFIDPTGWKGLALNRIEPLLRMCGEVIVNFMFDYINRLFGDPRPETNATFVDLFGGPGPTLGNAHQREEDIIKFYTSRLKTAGQFPFATYTRILKSTSDRTYFYLVYGTRHPKGVIEFRNVEKKLFDEQDRVRYEAKQEKRERKTKQPELFAAAEMMPPAFSPERTEGLVAARSMLIERLRGSRTLPYEVVLPTLLETPLVWEDDVRQMIAELSKRGFLRVKGMRPRERTVKKGHILELIAPVAE